MALNKIQQRLVCVPNTLHFIIMERRNLKQGALHFNVNIMSSLFRLRNTQRPAPPASYHGPWRDMPDSIMEEDSSDSPANPSNTTHTYPPQPEATSIPPLDTFKASVEPPLTATQLSKRSSESLPEDDDEDQERSVSLKVRLVAQNDRQQVEAMQKQEYSIAMIMKELAGLKTTVSGLYWSLHGVL